MAYTNAWSVTVPAGSELASTIDDHLRRLRLDIQERMNDIVTDWTADPVVLSAIAMPVVQKSAYYAIAGPVVSSYLDVAKVLALEITGDTDVNGLITVDLDAINTPYESANYYQIANFMGVSVAHNSFETSREVKVWQIDNIANTITLMVQDFDGVPAALNTVKVWLTMLFNG